MSGEVEFAKCDICNEEANVQRQYYYYDIKCDCCNSKEKPHFEIVRYCSSCKPKPPRVVRVYMEPIYNKETQP